MRVSWIRNNPSPKVGSGMRSTTVQVLAAMHGDEDEDDGVVCTEPPTCSMACVRSHHQRQLLSVE
eukprot:scaffold233670_cov19-Prasinocladus_malaysianus.AAC.1